MQSEWIFYVVRSDRWDLNFDNFEDGSAYWLHVGPVCFTFGFKSLDPVVPFRWRLAWAAFWNWCRRVEVVRAHMQQPRQAA